MSFFTNFVSKIFSSQPSSAPNWFPSPPVGFTSRELSYSRNKNFSLPPMTGVVLYHTILEEFHLTSNAAPPAVRSLWNRNQPAIPANEAGLTTLRVVIRVIITYIAIPYFCLGGIFYNSSMAIVKGSAFLACTLTQRNVFNYTQKQYLMDLKYHLGAGLSDGALKYLSRPFAIVYAIKPEFAMKYYNLAENYLNRKLAGIS